MFVVSRVTLPSGTLTVAKGARVEAEIRVRGLVLHGELKGTARAGTTVHLTIARKGETAPLEIDVTRAKIDVPSASGKMLDNGIGYIKLTSFGENTDSELKKTITDIKAKNPKGLILDLRGNGGGYLDTAIDVVSQFVDKGVVVSEEYGDGRKDTNQVRPGGNPRSVVHELLLEKLAAYGPRAARWGAATF